MADKENFISKEKRDAEEFAEIIKGIPEERKREAKFMLKGFVACAESEKKAV